MPLVSYRRPSEPVESTCRSMRKRPWRRARQHWRALINLSEIILHIWYQLSWLKEMNQTTIYPPAAIQWQCLVTESAWSDPSKLVKCPLKISSGYSLTQAIIHCPADVGRLMIRLIVYSFVIVLGTGWFRCSGAGSNGTNVTNILQSIQMLQSAHKWSPNSFKPKHDSERYWPWSTVIHQLMIHWNRLKS